MSITTAIAIHNIPEGLAICLVLIPRATSLAKASLWSIVTSLPQPLMAVPAYVFARMFEPLLPIGLGFAAGAMIWMVFAELIPDALKSATSGSIGILAMMLDSVQERRSEIGVSRAPGARGRDVPLQVHW